jgi:hypothetical protein
MREGGRNRLLKAAPHYPIRAAPRGGLGGGGRFGPAKHLPIDLWPLGQPCAFAFTALKKAAPISTSTITILFMVASLMANLSQSYEDPGGGGLGPTTHQGLCAGMPPEGGNTRLTQKGTGSKDISFATKSPTHSGRGEVGNVQACEDLQQLPHTSPFQSEHPARVNILHSATFEAVSMLFQSF